jgi:hypothetical protein
LAALSMEPHIIAGDYRRHRHDSFPSCARNG